MFEAILRFCLGDRNIISEHAVGTMCWPSKMVHADFGSGLIRPRAQTCCAELRRLARLANSPGFKSFRCPRWRIKFSLERFSDQSHSSLRAQPLKNSAGRVPQAADGTCEKNRKPDRVGRRGLSEPGGIFSRLSPFADRFCGSIPRNTSTKFEPLDFTLQ